MRGGRDQGGWVLPAPPGHATEKNRAGVGDAFNVMNEQEAQLVHTAFTELAHVLASCDDRVQAATFDDTWRHSTPRQVARSPVRVVWQSATDSYPSYGVWTSETICGGTRSSPSPVSGPPSPVCETCENRFTKKKRNEKTEGSCIFLSFFWNRSAWCTQD